MLYISGAVFWTLAWAAINPHAPALQTLCSAIFSWMGLVMWELIMLEYRKSK